MAAAKDLQLDGDIDAALAELKRAVAENPSLASAYAAIGDIYRKKDDLPEATSAYENAVMANPNNFRNHYNCGFLHQSLAQGEKVLSTVKEHLLRAVELYSRARNPAR